MAVKLWLLVPLVGLARCGTDTFTGDGGGPDASGDVTATDGSVGVGDGKSDAVTMPSRFCDMVDAAFCADFDIPGDAGAGFADAAIVPQANLLFEMKTVYSDPVSVELVLPSAGTGSALLPTGVPFNPGASNLHLDMDMQFAPVPTTATNQIPLFFFGDPAFPFGLALWAGKYQLFQRSNPTAYPLSGTLPANQWVHVHLDVHLGTANGSAIVTVTQTSSMLNVTGGTPTTLQTEQSPAPPTIMLQLGGSDTAPPMNDLNYFYDNVVVRYE